MSSKSLDFNEISSNAMMQFSKHPPQSPLNKGGIKEGYALQELHHNTPLIPPLSRGELKGGVACNPAHAGQATMPLINAFFGCMPCKTYDLLVKVQSWEFGSSPT